MEMETWFIILISLCISALIKLIFNLIVSPPNSSSLHHKKLPPGPPIFPVIGNFLWLLKSYSEIESILRSSWAKYGPIITIRIGPRPAIFIGSNSVAHKALIQNGAVFSDRPTALTFSKTDNSSQHKISSAAYGPKWRLLRRNLTSGVLHPTRVGSYSAARQWVLEVLINRLVVESQSAAQAVRVIDHFQYAMFGLLVLMCFGDRLDEKQIKEVNRVQCQVMLRKNRLVFLNFWPTLISKIVFRKSWKELKQLNREQEEVFIPLVRSRTEIVKRRRGKKEEEQEQESIVSYVDTLLDLELPEEKRKLNDKEIVNLCSEFLNAGTDTTVTALQWIMANLVKCPALQTKLFEEINRVMGPPPQPGEKNEKGDMAMIEEKDLHTMPYLKCVVLEGLRRHPPGHVLLPHSVAKDVELEGYLVPKDTTVNFMVADIGWDPKVWDEPMEFKPERFFTKTIDGGGSEATDSFDITGKREIKMMPFGVGRRICPALELALLHLEFLVANLVWNFEWTPMEGDTVDLSEKQEFNVGMKYPLRAHISPRGLPQNQ